MLVFGNTVFIGGQARRQGPLSLSKITTSLVELVYLDKKRGNTEKHSSVALEDMASLILLRRKGK